MVQFIQNRVQHYKIKQDIKKTKKQSKKTLFEDHGPLDTRSQLRPTSLQLLFRNINNKFHLKKTRFHQKNLEKLILMLQKTKTK